MSDPGGGAALRVAWTADAPEHPEAAAIAAWLDASPGLEGVRVELDEAATVMADVVWIHGVRPVPLEAAGTAAPDLLLRGRVLLTGGAAVLPAAAGVDPAAPNGVGRVRAADLRTDDDLPPLRGDASFRGHPLFAGLGSTAVTWAPGPGEARTVVAYALPSWPARGRVLAVARSRTAILADRATIWEYDGDEGRTLCLGAFPGLDSGDRGIRGAAGRLVENALRRAAAAPTSGDDGETWHRPDPVALEDRSMPLPELPLLEDSVGPLDFRLRLTGPAEDDAPFHVAGRRAFAAGGAARGVDQVWAHPVRIASDLRLTGARAEAVTMTPVGVERRIAVAGETVLERVVVPREAPACVVEWLSRTRTVEIEVTWTCDLLPAPPYPAAGPLRWRKAARGVVVGGPLQERAVFAFSTPPLSLEVEDASGHGRPLVHIRARIRLPARAPVRLAMAGAAGDVALRRALAAADRTAALTRGRQGHTERVLGEGLTLEVADPAAVQEIEWAKHHLNARLVEAPGLGRCLVPGYGGAADTRDGLPVRGVTFDGAHAVGAALACLAGGDFRSARDVLVFLGRHQDPAGRVFRSCSTTGFVRHDDPAATPLYLLLAARYVAWTGDLGTLRAEWGRVTAAYEAALLAAGESAARPSGRAEVSPGAILGGVLAELADAAESIGEGGAAMELRHAAAERGGSAWSFRPSSSPLTVLAGEVLGCEPDAPQGRLVLRPRPPDGWGRFRVRGLPLGDARLGVHYRRKAGVHTFHLSQDRGAAPVRVILEPSLPGRRLVAATVDGAPAELDPKRAGDRLVVPLQVVMDHDREVVLEVDGSIGSRGGGIDGEWREVHDRSGGHGTPAGSG